MKLIIFFTLLLSIFSAHAAIGSNFLKLFDRNYISFEKSNFDQLSEIVTMHHTYSFNCTSESNCNYNGHCNDLEDSCICDHEWTTYSPPKGTQCNYKRKNQLTAFLLQLFLGKISGAGYWYVEQYALALGETLFFWIGLIFICIAPCIRPDISEDSDITPYYVCFYYLWILTWVIWCIVSWIMFAMNEINDGYGVTLNPW